MTRVVPFLPDAAVTTIEIDGVTYSPPLVDSDRRLFVTPRSVGAGEVLSRLGYTSDDSSTRVAFITPGSGEKVRIVSATISTTHATASDYEIYFGIGTFIYTYANKGILWVRLDTDIGRNHSIVWPDGGGPVGINGEVVSIRTSVNIVGGGHFLIHYRLES